MVEPNTAPTAGTNAGANSGPLPHAELVALQRSAAMGAPGSAVAVRRELLLALVDELLATRSLLARVGGDLRTIARHARG